MSESLLGGMVVVLEPGGDKTMIKPGGEITKTQDAISLHRADRQVHVQRHGVEVMNARVPKAPPVWRQSDGKPVSCLEKIKVLNQNIQEIETLCADALEDGVLMGCDADQIKAGPARADRRARAPHTDKKLSVRDPAGHRGAGRRHRRRCRANAAGRAVAGTAAPGQSPTCGRFPTGRASGSPNCRASTR